MFLRKSFTDILILTNSMLYLYVYRVLENRNHHLNCLRSNAIPSVDNVDYCNFKNIDTLNIIYDGTGESGKNYNKMETQPITSKIRFIIRLYDSLTCRIRFINLPN